MRLKMSVITNLDKELFEQLIKSSNSWIEVMMYFKNNHGYKSITANRTVKNRCIKENISFVHFNNGKAKVELSKTDKYYNSSNLKKRLLKEGTFEEKCSKCGLGTIWQEEPISLQLEHIDGDHYNNELNNLTILCPNCHSQTKTWCGRNSNKSILKCVDCDKQIKKGAIRCKRCAAKKRHNNKKEKNEPPENELEEDELEEDETKKCSDCQEPISKNSTRCQSCASKQQTRKVHNRPSLDQLENDLEELRTYTAVGRKYEVSDNTIRKWIKGYRVSKINT